MIDDVTRDSLKQAGGILVSLSPLFAFWFISLGHSLLRLQIGIYAGVALLIAMAVLRLSRGTMLLGTAVFFGIALVFAAWMKNEWVIRHLGVIASGTLFVAVMVTMVMGHPFVLEYARVGASPDQLESAAFMRTCYALTSFWASVLLVMALVSVAQLSHPGPGRVAYLFIQLGILVTAIAYQVAYIVHVKHRARDDAAASVH